jgi:hypothetical protein
MIPVFEDRDIISEELEAETDDAADDGLEGIVEQEAGREFGEKVEGGAEEESQPVAGFPMGIL